MAVQKYGTWVLTDSSKPDRHGTRIDINSLDLSAYERNPIVTMGHDDARPIGYAADLLKENGRLIFDLMIDPDASEAAAEAVRLIEAEVLRACSAEFLGRADQNGLFTNAELVAASIVSIPSNPAAVRIRENEAGTKTLITEQPTMNEAETQTETEETTPMTEQRAAPAAPSGNAQPLAPAVHTKRHEYSLRKVIARQVQSKPVDGIEAEADEEIRHRQQWREFQGIQAPLSALGLHKRASSTGSGANMQPLTGTGTLDSLFDQIDSGIAAESLLDKLPVTRMEGLTESRVNVPRQTGMMAADHTALDSDLSVSADPTFSNQSLEPKLVGGIAQVNLTAILAQHPALGNTDFIGGELRRALMAEIESVFLTGDHTSNDEEPDGLINSGTATGFSVTAGNAVSLFANVRATLRNYLQDSTASGHWILHPDFADALLTQPAFTGATTSAYDALGLDNGTLLGSPVDYSTAIAKSATTAGYYMQPETLIHGTWQGVSIVVNPWETGVFKKGAALVRVMMMHDIAPIDAKRIRHFDYDLS